MISLEARSAARAIAEQRFEHPLISAFLDLDPTRFAVAGARATEINSLLDGAEQELYAGPPGEHADRMALAQDISRIGSYLGTGIDPSGAQSVAVYCSARASLFQAIRLPYQVPSELVIGRVPKLEPLLGSPEPACVCVALVSRADARIFIHGAGVKRAWRRFEDQVQDPVHGQHRQGGWSEANYERSIENDVDAHLRRVAEHLYELWRGARFDRLVLGGPHELVARFRPLLHADLRGLLDPAELSLDVGSASAPEVEQALVPLRQHWREHVQREALDRLLHTMGVRDGTAVGVPDTLAALGKRQVAALVLAPRVDLDGSECPRCEQLSQTATAGRCEVDGAELTALSSLRCAMVRAALLQDAELIVLDEFEDRPELAAFDGVGAILRY